MTGSEIRTAFIEFFKSKGHTPFPARPWCRTTIRRCCSPTPGMNQFKDVFLGLREARLHARDDRAEVRARRRQAQRPRERRLHRAPPHLLRDARQLHLRRLLQGRRASPTPGSCSPSVYGLPTDRLWVTVFDDDDEAFDVWHERRSACRPERIVRIGDNIGLDEGQLLDDGRHRPVRPVPRDLLRPWARASPAARRRLARRCDGDRWHRDLEPRLHAVRPRRRGRRRCTPLPKPCVDTGMGLERLAAVLQGVHSQLRHRPVRSRSSAAAASSRGKAYGDATDDDVSLRVIADHAAPTAFLDRRRRAPRQRGPRLRAAPHHAPRDPPRLASSASTRAVLAQVVPDAGRADGRRLPRAAGAQQRRSCDDADGRRRSASAATLDRGMRHARRRARALRGRGETVLPATTRVQALRHLRLPARSDRGHRRERGSRSTTPASTPRMASSSAQRARGRQVDDRGRGGIARHCSGVGAPSSSATSALTARRRVVARCRRGRQPRRARGDGRRRSRSCSTARRSTPSPAARSATPARIAGAGGLRARRRRHAEVRPALIVHHGERQSRARSRSATRSTAQVDAERRDATARNHSRDAPAAQGAARGARRARAADGLAGRARPAALRLHALRGR